MRCVILAVATARSEVCRRRRRWYTHAETRHSGEAAVASCSGLRRRNSENHGCRGSCTRWNRILHETGSGVTHGRIVLVDGTEGQSRLVRS